jgi:RNA polymerase sigma-70 factor, ECF subfamily
MDEQDWLATRFEEHRGHLRAVAYRMLGSVSEADDAVQESWLRLARASASDIDNLGGWLTTVVGRVCLDMLRTRTSRREEPAGPHLPDPVVGTDPEQQALLADSVGLALLVVLDTLDPAERLAFVLHDMFGLPFDEIAPVVGRSTVATRQLASRARRRVQGSPTPDTSLDRQRRVVDAFFAAARDGDFDALVSVLDPEVVLRSEGGVLPTGASRVLHGAAAVANQALLFRRAGAHPDATRPVVVNGAAGLLVTHDGRPAVLFAFTVQNDHIATIDVIQDPERLASLSG